MSLIPTALYMRDNATMNPCQFTGSQTTTAITVASTQSGALQTGMLYTGNSIAPAGIISAGSGASWTSTVSTTFGVGSSFTACTSLTAGSVGWSAVAGWVASHAYAAGALVRQSCNGAVFTGSTSGSSTTVTVASITSGKLTAGQTIYYNNGSAVISSVNADPATSITLTGAITLASQVCVASLAAFTQRVFACIVAGTSGTLEPSWSVARGTKTTDNGATWIEITGHPALNGDTANSGIWTSSAGPALGAVIVNVGGGQSAGAYVFVCTTTGTMSGAEPTWNITAGVTTTAGGSAVWTCLGPSSNFAAWAAPGVSLLTMCGTTFLPAGASLFIANDHSEITYAIQSFGTTNGTPASPVNILSVNPATVPPTSSSLLPGATIGTVGNIGISMALSAAGWYFYGVTLQSGSGSGTAGTAIGGAKLVLDTCTLAQGGLGSVTGIDVNTIDAVLTNCSFKFPVTGARMRLISGKVKLKNCTSFFAAGSAIPTTLFAPASSNALVEVDGCDLSSLAGGTVTSGLGWAILNGCKIGASTVLSATPTAGQRVDAINCDSAGSNYQKARYAYAGTLTNETGVVRTSGAAIGSTAVSDKIVTNANTSWVNPFNAMPLAIWNTTVGSSVTVTLYGVYNGTALPNNDEAWIEIDYSSSASTPITTVASTTKTNPLSTIGPTTADTSAWDTLATARPTNAPTPAVGQAYAVSTNTGRIFFCTVSGAIASGAPPGGYASAVDGGTVTDGSATFRAGVRFRIGLAVTPQLVGPIYAVAKIGKASSTYYIDPLPVLS